jgi:tRNA modification GTPase
VLVDTAGIRESHSGSIEAIGIEKARAQISDADILLWLGHESDAPAGSIVVRSKADIGSTKSTGAHHFVSSVTGQGIEGLVSELEADARKILPLPDQIAFSRAQKRMVSEAADALFRAAQASDLLVVGEELRSARASFDTILGRNSTEQMLDALFGRFCIGK